MPAPPAKYPVRTAPGWQARRPPRTTVNPGSVGLPAYDDTHPYLHFIETGSPHARYAIAERIASGWQINLHCVMYDFESMARLAESRDRTEWAVALRTGRMG